MIKNIRVTNGRQQVGKYMVIDPEICHGQMTFKGTRVPVTTVLALMAKGYSLDQMLRSYPEVTRPALESAIHLAIASLKERYRFKSAPIRRRATA